MGDTYRDRAHAGAVVARLLAGFGGRPDAVVLGLARGGVPVAVVVARHLGLPVDVLVVRKLGVPWMPEVAFGALGPGGVQVVNEDVAARLDASAIAQVVRRETGELIRREQHYRAGRPPLDLTGRAVLIVDDGLATGATARAAVAVVRGMGAGRVVVAAPVGSPDAVAALKEVADDVVCPAAPTDFGAVSRHYDRFPQVSHRDVVAALAGYRADVPPTGTVEECR